MWGHAKVCKISSSFYDFAKVVLSLKYEDRMSDKFCYYKDDKQ